MSCAIGDHPSVMCVVGRVVSCRVVSCRVVSCRVVSCRAHLAAQLKLSLVVVLVDEGERGVLSLGVDGAELREGAGVGVLDGKVLRHWVALLHRHHLLQRLHATKTNN